MKCDSKNRHQINQIATSWINKPPNEIIPTILKSFQPVALVLFQTALLLIVQGVRIPKNQFALYLREESNGDE